MAKKQNSKMNSFVFFHFKSPSLLALVKQVMVNPIIQIQIVSNSNYSDMFLENQFQFIQDQIKCVRIL